MKDTTPSRRRDDLVELYAIPQRIVADFAALCESRPEMGAAVLKDLQSMIGVRDKHEIPDKRNVGVGPTTASRVIDVLRDNPKGLTKVEISDKSGVSESTLHSLLYGTHRAHFEFVKNPAGGKAKLVRLKGGQG